MSPIPFSLNSVGGERRSSGGSLRRRRARGVIAKVRHRTISALGSRSSSLSIASRARAARIPLKRADLSAVGQQRARSVNSATRWRRLLAAVADFVLALFQFRATMELGPSRRSIMRRRGAGERRELGGHRQGAAPNDQRFRARVPPLYPLPRAAKGRPDSLEETKHPEPKA